jgi:hypothetical protein
MELEADAIEELRCGGGARRQRVERRRAAVSAPARLAAAAAVSGRTSEEGSGAQSGWRGRRCAARQG